MYNYTTHYNVYYISGSDTAKKNYGVLFENNDDIKTVILGSTYYVKYNYSQYNDSIQNDTNIDINNYIYISNKCIKITLWMSGWGHLIDSILNLANFYYNNKFDEQEYKVLLDIPVHLENILEISTILFGNNLININSKYFDQNKLIKIPELILIKNDPSELYFLNFQDNILNKLHNYWNDDNIQSVDNIFLTRIKLPEHRILKNHDDLESYFSNKNFSVINPEYLSNKEVFNIVKNAKNIIITNGSALCSLIYINKNTKIFCLNSESYLPNWRQKCKSIEDIPIDNVFDFEKLIWKTMTKQFNFTYIDSWLNIITEEQCTYIMNNLN